MAFWNMYFIFRDPSVAARARDEVDAALLNPSNPSLSSTNPAFSMPKLTSQPLLQSSYAETLRMRMSTMAIRSPEGNDFKLNEWVFPKGVSIGMPSPLTHMDSTMWNTGKDNDRPVKQYWADRFIIDPSNPNNIGPVKNPPPVDEKERPEKRTFSMDGTSGLWVPYGGGIFQCPGRFFAKGEIMAAHALLAAFFDVELMEPDKEPRPNMEYYLMGGVPPMDAVPFRIRKRQRE